MNPKEIPRRLRKPKVGKNYAVRPGAGFHSTKQQPPECAHEQWKWYVKENGDVECGACGDTIYEPEV